MKILSFDVGINNLSYIKMEKQDNNYNIFSWDNINIYNNIENTLICCEKYKNNTKVCSKKAKFYIDTNGNFEYFCGIHSKKKDINLLKKVEKKKKKKKIFLELNIKIIELLDNLNLCDVDYVLIEQQPQRNPTMKNISIILFNYFTIRGIIDKCENKINKVMFISPKNKLKGYDGPEINIKSKNQYTKRKKLAIEHCKYYLKENEKDLNYFLSLKKKDDAADCFLQGVWFLKNN